MTPLALDQARTAEHLGYGPDIDQMNMEHDPLHGALCHFLGISSYALAQARGERLTDQQQMLANAEESAVLACQKLRQMHRVQNG
jgi:hypothetical protein